MCISSLHVLAEAAESSTPDLQDVGGDIDVAADEDEDENETCGFCKYMKGGPCREPFKVGRFNVEVKALLLSVGCLALAQHVLQRHYGGEHASLTASLHVEDRRCSSWISLSVCSVCTLSVLQSTVCWGRQSLNTDLFKTCD